MTSIYTHGYFGKRHIPIESLKRGLLSHLKGEAIKVARDLIREGLLVAKKTQAETHERIVNLVTETDELKRKTEAHRESFASPIDLEVSPPTVGQPIGEEGGHILFMTPGGLLKFQRSWRSLRLG